MFGYPRAEGRIFGLLLCAGLFFSIFTVLSSLGFLALTDLFNEFHYPLWQWWSYFNCCRNDADVWIWLLISGVPAAAVTLFFVIGSIILYRRARQSTIWPSRLSSGVLPDPVRSRTTNFGDARWLTMAEAGEIFPGPFGVVVGEAYEPSRDKIASVRFDGRNRRSWGRGGAASLLIDRCDNGPGHSLIISGSGGFKSSCAVATLLNWRGGVIVLDPAGELSAIVAEARRAMGHRVHILDLQNAATAGFNALDWITPGSVSSDSDLAQVIEWSAGYTPKREAAGEFFKSSGKNLALCLLAHLCADPTLPDRLKTLRTMREAISNTEVELKKILKTIHNTSPSSLAKELAGPLSDLTDETFGGIFATAHQDSAWLATKAYSDLVSGTAFNTSDIIDGHTDVFVSLPLKVLQTTPAIARVVIGAMLNACYEAAGSMNDRLLFLLDEVYLLGFMNILATARDAGRKFGAVLQLLYQSVNQIDGQWGRDGRGAWFESTSWRSFSSVRDIQTAEEISRTCGEYGVMAKSDGSNIGMSGRPLSFASRSRGRNRNVHEIRRRLILPADILAMRDDEQIVLGRGLPLRCGRALYWRRPEMVGRTNPNPYVRTQ